eukprot:Sspe_Gene.117526::Locus_108970_Transcript_1_1_Confidence_1.000_Length_652::g.117526::m.117526
MVLWEAVLILQPMMPRDSLHSVLSLYCRHLLKNGAVVRKLSNEGVMRLHRGMYAGPVDKRRLYVPAKHRWRIHEPVDEKMWYHGRYVVMLFDCNLDTAYSFQSLVNQNDATLEWQIRQRDKHHPLAAFRDPHEYEIGHDLENPTDEDMSVKERTKQWEAYLGRRWADYLTMNPNPTVPVEARTA